MVDPSFNSDSKIPNTVHYTMTLSDIRKDPAKFLILFGSIIAGVGTILLIVFSIVFIFSGIEFSCRPQPCTPLTGAPLYLLVLGIPGLNIFSGLVCLAIGLYKRKKIQK